MSKFNWLIGDRIESASYETESQRWIVTFHSGAVLSIEAMWRLIEDGRICSTSLDHGHLFGRPKPFDGIAALKEMGQYSVEKVEVDEPTGDLFITLVSLFELQILSTSAGYEPWQLTHPTLGMWVVSGGVIHEFAQPSGGANSRPTGACGSP